MTTRAVPIIPNFFAGQKLTGTIMNQISTVQTFQNNPPMFRAYQSITQSIANTTDVQITLDNRDYDTDGAWQSSTPYNIVIPAGMTGRWSFTWSVASGVNAVGARDAYLKRNGARLSGSATSGAAADNDYVQAFGTTTIAVNAGDTIALFFWQNSGGALNTQVGANNTSILEGRLISLANP